VRAAPPLSFTGGNSSCVLPASCLCARQHFARALVLSSAGCAVLYAVVGAAAVALLGSNLPDPIFTYFPHDGVSTTVPPLRFARRCG
jgi:hypothetical protein